MGRLTFARSSDLAEDPRDGILNSLCRFHMAAPSILPEIGDEVDGPGTRGSAWIVTVYNNDYNTYDEVMRILILATACSAEEAYIEAWEIDHFGKCVVHQAGEQECRDVAKVIATIGIRVEVSQE